MKYITGVATMMNKTNMGIIVKAPSKTEYNK